MQRSSLAQIAALAVMLLAGSYSSAHATFIEAPATITVGESGDSVFFTFAGYSADDRDQLRLVGSGGSIILFTNQTTPVGTVFDTGPLAAGQYILQLWNLTTGQVYSSNPSKNIHDGDYAHLVETTNFADFHLGPAPFANPLYFGWEDEPSYDTDSDYNDLVFTIFVDPPLAVPEPSSLALLLVALAGLALVGWRMRAGIRGALPAG